MKNGRRRDRYNTANDAVGGSPAARAISKSSYSVGSSSDRFFIDIDDDDTLELPVRWWWGHRDLFYNEFITCTTSLGGSEIRGCHCSSLQFRKKPAMAPRRRIRRPRSEMFKRYQAFCYRQAKYIGLNRYGRLVKCGNEANDFIMAQECTSERRLIARRQIIMRNVDADTMLVNACHYFVKMVNQCSSSWNNALYDRWYEMVLSWRQGQHVWRTVFIAWRRINKNVEAEVVTLWITESEEAIE